MKKIILLAIAIMFISINAFSQEKVRYVVTKCYDADYVPYEVSNPGSIELKFYGNNRIVQDFNWGALEYKYSHSEDGNRVYYMVAIDIITGQEHIVKDSVIMVSSDRSLINIISYTNGNHYSTTVYERKEADRPRQMLR